MNAKHGLAASHLLPNATFEWMPGYGHMLHHFCAEAILQAALRMEVAYDVAA